MASYGVPTISTDRRGLPRTATTRHSLPRHGLPRLATTQRGLQRLALTRLLVAMDCRGWPCQALPRRGGYSIHRSTRGWPERQWVNDDGHGKSRDPAARMIAVGLPNSAVDVAGCVCENMASYGVQTISTDRRGSPPITMDYHGSPPFTMDRHGSPRIATDRHGSPWIATGRRRLLRIATDRRRLPQITTDRHRSS